MYTTAFVTLLCATAITAGCTSRPLRKAAVRGGVRVLRRLRELREEIAEEVEDLTAEVSAEWQA
jgi:hypothetical protein